jgi:hypothetical protein
MTVRINASSAGLTETVDTSGILEFQTANTSALIIDANQNANFSSTGSITVSVGTTAQRPTPSNGMIRYNSNAAAFEVYANNSWATANVTPAPVVSVAPVISGSVSVGNNLTSTTGSWANNPTGYFYQWRANSVAITSNATANVFTLTSSQVGANITCNVTAFNAAGNSIPSTSNSLGPVVADYQINNSLRFRSSATAFLSRTNSSAPTSATTWTYSTWVKRGSLGATRPILNAYSSTTATSVIDFSSDNIRVLNIDPTGNQRGIVTNAVYRDPSAWYHIVVSSTASSTPKLYVNGVEVTSFSSSSAVTASWYFGSNSVAQWIGREQFGAGNDYFDGYLAEVNFIDGQSLTPSSFGETDTITGVWKPKAYTGTYGTNGFYLPFKLGSSTFAGSFNGSSQYLQLPSGSGVGAFGTGDFTIECWVNPASYAAVNSMGGSRTPAGTANGFNWGILTNGSFQLYSNADFVNSGAGTVPLNTWTHLAITRQGGTMRSFVNGILRNSASNTQDFNLTTFWIGATGAGGAEFFNGSISNYRVVKGTSLYNSTFVPLTSSLTAVANTSLLTLQNSTIIDNSTNAFTITNVNSVTTSVQYPFALADFSGNSNNWIPNNINLVSGTTYDSMTDVPTRTSTTTANYAVINPLVNSPNPNGTITNGNLLYTGTGSSTSTYATMAVTSGKFYFETTMQGIPSTPTAFIGIAPYVYSVSNLRAYRYDTGEYFNGTAWAAYGATFTTNDVIGCALDMDSQTIEFFKNGASQGQKTSIGLSGQTVAPFLFINNSPGAFSTNFGQQPFAYTPPSGFVALNTFNLPTSTIVAGNKNMDATTYTGNGSTQTITNAGAMKPDLIWIKSRSNTYNHFLTDSVRGASKYLISNSTDAEADAGSAGITAFNSNGFSMGSGTALNANAATYVGWQWQAGQGTTSSNTQGSITSTVSANATAGFSIVTCTTPASGTFTVGHGLGVAPSLVIIKGRTTAGYTWNVYHRSAGAGGLLVLNSSNAFASNTGVWQNTNPTSTIVYGNSSNWGGSEPYVMYCWAEVAGFSRFGSYTGNGSTDGVFVYTGFRPKWVMFKRTDSGAGWLILDSSRNTFNVMNNQLYANSADAESGGATADFLSNGIKIRETGGGTNANGGSYVFMAFAENPFKNSLAR